MTCENCGAADHELVRVHRVYHHPTEHALEEVERWCVSCLTMYPYELAAPEAT